MKAGKRDLQDLAAALRVDFDLPKSTQNFYERKSNENLLSKRVCAFTEFMTTIKCICLNQRLIPQTDTDLNQTVRAIRNCSVHRLSGTQCNFPVLNIYG